MKKPRGNKLDFESNIKYFWIDKTELECSMERFKGNEVVLESNEIISLRGMRKIL